MPLPASLQVALKEWAIVCRAIETGRQLVLLRKGGIYESAGEFELEHRQFLLFPTYLHQNAKMLKGDAHPGLETRDSEPQRVRLWLAGEVTDIVQLSSPAQMDAVDDEHVWAPPLIDMRFNYRPANPLYLLLVRAYRLPRAAEVENTPAYAGCKSWVPLGEAVDVAGATPTLGDAEFEARRGDILRRIR